MNQYQESVLLSTSLQTDSQSSGGNLQITGLTSTKKTNISSIVQIKSRSEVSQVVTVGNTLISGVLYVPTGSTRYGILIGDTNRIRVGASELLKPYFITTPPDITTFGLGAVLQREAITQALIAVINADTKSFVVAASLGSGNGFTITDTVGYYNVFSQTTIGRLGANQVTAIQNSDRSGLSPANVVITTTAVYPSGQGAYLNASTPVIDALYGGLLSGYFKGLYNGLSFKTVSANPALNNLSAVAGQLYDLFIVTSLTTAQAHNQRGQLAFIPKMQAVAVDNGAGPSPANLAGFVAFEREMLRAVGSVYDQDQSAISDFFDAALVGPTVTTTGLPVATPAADNVAVAAYTGANELYYNPNGAATIQTPIVTTNGLPLTLDAFTQKGYELTPPNLTQNPKQFVVGKIEASYYGRINIGANVGTTTFKSFSFGFKRKGAYAVDQTAYEAASLATAALGIPLDTGVAPVFNTITGPGTASIITNTSTPFAAVANTSYDFLITVDINGSTRFYLNGIDRTPATGYIFTAGIILMPFVTTRNAISANAAPFLIQELFLPSITWRG